ncbi:hypothetical protein Hypma_013946 [Hypsizygus marmoreus]|uniref:Uncharacterized protein n=1 Tax=Hypsizygus marmoreus TaxID=39966 RepID=A0A369K864_HYPMA|nr:hypothetical protein Hypma_013946 [Hypsizygus marmoreus]
MLLVLRRSRVNDMVVTADCDNDGVLFDPRLLLDVFAYRTGSMTLGIATCIPTLYPGPACLCQGHRTASPCRGPRALHVLVESLERLFVQLAFNMFNPEMHTSVYQFSKQHLRYDLVFVPSPAKHVNV